MSRLWEVYALSALGRYLGKSLVTDEQVAEALKQASERSSCLAGLVAGDTATWTINLGNGSEE